MNKSLLGFMGLFLLVALLWLVTKGFLAAKTPQLANQPISPTSAMNASPLMIDVMRQQSYPGSDLKIEQTLAPGSNYHQYIASYFSQGLKIYGLLTVPFGEKPAAGWPVIIFNHGYIPPTQYKTTERYVAYVDGFARNGYIVFKADYRGNGNSEGKAEGAYYSPSYTIDVLNALSSVKKYPGVDVNRIGMWGHSMGGNITLRSLVISPDIKAAVIWGGVVGTYDDLMNNWQRRVTYQPPPSELANRNGPRADLVNKFGTPTANLTFWHAIDPNYYLNDINAPVQLHAGLSDEEVPWDFSQGLDNRLKQAGKTVEFYTYPGADHNISGPSFEIAMQRSVDFFNKYLKGGEK